MSFPRQGWGGLWRQLCLRLHFSDGVTEALRAPSYSHTRSQTEWELKPGPCLPKLPPPCPVSLALTLPDLQPSSLGIPGPLFFLFSAPHPVPGPSNYQSSGHLYLDSCSYAGSYTGTQRPGGTLGSDMTQPVPCPQEAAALYPLPLLSHPATGTPPHTSG